MTLDSIRHVFQRIAAIRRSGGYATDYHSIVACVSDLSGEPYQRVFDACLEEPV